MGGFLPECDPDTIRLDRGEGPHYNRAIEQKNCGAARPKGGQPF